MQLAHKIQWEERRSQRDACEIHKAPQCKIDEWFLAEDQLPVFLEPLRFTPLQGDDRDDPDRQVEVAGEVITDQSADGEDHEDQLVIEREAHPVQHLANDDNGDSRSESHDRPAPGHQLKAAFRTGDGIHHHAEENGNDGLWAGLPAPRSPG